MPCFHPLQARFRVRADGLKDIEFSNSDAVRFQAGVESVDSSNLIGLPCGRCIGCRLERARQWSVRIMHEASLYSDNCFVTLTFDDEHRVKMCPNGSIVKSHCQNFMKRLRQEFSGRKIRYYCCGEYGERFFRPHYHFCLFNLDFPDKVHFGGKGDALTYTSVLLSKVWPYGHSVIGTLTSESAQYVARYCMKKVTGDHADEWYRGRQPEFALMSTKPGIGRGWLDKFGETDVWSHDDVIVAGRKCKPPRYYDKVLQQQDPARYLVIKHSRDEAALEQADNATYARLRVREKCRKAKMKDLRRSYEGVSS